MLCLVGTRASRDLLQLAGRVDGINAQKAVFHRKTAVNGNKKPSICRDGAGKPQPAPDCWSR